MQELTSQTKSVLQEKRDERASQSTAKGATLSNCEVQERFNRILCIELEEIGKEKVLSAIDMLKDRIWHNFVNYAKESDVEKRAILLSYVLTTLKTDRNSSLSDRPALPLVA